MTANLMTVGKRERDRSFWAATHSNGLSKAHSPAHRQGPPKTVAMVITATKGTAESKLLAYWLHERWGVNSAILGIWLGLPRSTVMGWVRRVQRQPDDFQGRVLACFDDIFDAATICVASAGGSVVDGKQGETQS